MPIRLGRAHVREPTGLRLVVVWTKAVHPDLEDAVRGREMDQRRDEAGHAPVLIRLLTGEAEQNIPERVDAKLCAPLQYPDVLECGNALVHQLEDRRAEALQPRLELADPG